MRYLDLLNGKKPHLLISMVNNLGAETKLHYASSTKFYLEDRDNPETGIPWITKLAFPVQVVEKVETIDQITGNRLVSTYRYRHGYFDGEEREFRGFGYVEQRDTETFEVFQGDGVTNATDESLHIPPILTKTWFHTGFYLDREHISQLFAEEYYTEDAQAVLLPDTILPGKLSSQEQREACRSLRGQVLRQEVYALDESDRAEHPYTVTESNYEIRLVQPLANERYAVFFTHPRESIAYQYERNPDDPRIARQMTLKVDEFGNVLQSLAIAYSRRTPEHPEQGQTLVTYTENQVTNKPDEENWYRIGIPIETITYEITGLPAATLYSLEEVREHLASASDLAYEDTPSAGVLQKRVIEQVITFYRADSQANTIDPARLELGEVESLALPCESFKLAFTPGLLNSIYNSKIGTGELNNLLSQEGKYVQLEGNWWIPSGRQAFAPAQFYLVTEAKDPFEQIYQTTYDSYQLLATETVDPLGNMVRVRNNYRTLQPEEITDPNGNRAQVTFDALGMVAGTAVMGKVASTEGDSLDNFEADLSQQQIDDFSQNPLATAVTLLGNATTRVELDIEGNQRSVTDALERKVMVYDYDLLGNVIHQHSMEAGERWLINDVAGNPIRRWDSRNQMFRMYYDELQRLSHSFVQQPGEGETLVERLVYGETHSEVERNLKGKLYQHYDQAGVVTNERFDFKGNLLSSSRQLATEYKQTVDWLALSTLTDLDDIANAALSNLDTSVQGIFTSLSQYDALNRPVMMVTPHNSTTRPNVIQPSYNEANLLEKVDVWLRQSTTPTNLLNPSTADLHAVTNINYNAKGQRTLIEYGNQTTTSYKYDTQTFRLTRMLTIRP